MNPAVVLVIVLWALFLVMWVLTRRNDVEETDAIKILLEMGADVVIGNWHVYRGQKGPKDKSAPYVILHFSRDGKLYRDEEESFTDINDAAAKFLQRTRA